MNILIVTQYYFPEQFQINEVAPELVKRGHNVTVLTGLPNYPQGEIYPGYKNKRTEEKDGVKIIRVPIHPRKHGSVHMIWNYASYAVNGSKMVKRIKEKYDIVFAYQLSPITSLYPAVIYKKSRGAAIINYCLDIWPESAKDHVGKGLIYKYIGNITQKLYEQCDHIAVTSRPFIDYLNRYNGINLAKISYLPQHADGSYLSMDLSSPDNGIADFMYAGNLGKGQWVDVIVRAAAEIKDESFKVHLVGDGSYRSQLEKLVMELDVEDKVIFYGNQKREDMPEFYRKADALLITLRGNNFVGNTMPGKLQTYMTCGKPIFGAINGATAEVIKEAQCGSCVKAGDYKGLAMLMKKYIANPSDYEACGRNAKAYFELNFTLKHYCDDLEELLENIT